MSDERPIRGCGVCGRADDHPRHVVGLVNARGPAPEPRHIDCCAAAGCAACAQTVAESEGRTGQALIEWLAAQRARRAKEQGNG